MYYYYQLRTEVIPLNIVSPESSACCIEVLCVTKIEIAVRVYICYKYNMSLTNISNVYYHLSYLLFTTMIVLVLALVYTYQNSRL